MASAASAFAQVSSVLLAAFSLIGVLIRWFVDHPGDEYEDKVREIQEDRWRSVSASLGELFVQVEEEFHPTEVEEEDAPLSAKYGMFIKSQHNRGLLDDLEDELESMDEPKRLFKQCRGTYDATFWMFITALLVSVPAFVVVRVVSNPIVLVVASILVGIGIILFLRGLWKAYRYWQARQSLDEMWEDHHLY